MLNPFSVYSKENHGFHLEVDFEESKSLFTVVNIKSMGILELIAFILAFIVGFIVIA